MKLDQKDWSLLRALDEDSRQPYVRLAKRLRLSKDAVIYRIRRLEKEGVVRGLHAVVDAGRIGMLGFRLLLKFTHLTPEREAEAIAFLLANEHLRWAVSAEGKWDLNTYFLYRTAEEMYAFYEELFRRYGNNVEERNLAIYVRLEYFNRGFPGANERKSVVAYSIGGQERLDKEDEAILHAVERDARTSALELGRQAGVTAVTAIRKLRSLEERGIITGYRAVFDLEKLGYLYYKLHVMLFETTPERTQGLRNYLRMQPAIVYEDVIMGGFDLEYELQVRSVAELRAFISELRARFADIIKDHEVLNYYGEHRLSFL